MWPPGPGPFGRLGFNTAGVFPSTSGRRRVSARYHQMALGSGEREPMAAGFVRRLASSPLPSSPSVPCSAASHQFSSVGSRHSSWSGVRGARCRSERDCRLAATGALKWGSPTLNTYAYLAPIRLHSPLQKPLATGPPAGGGRWSTLELEDARHMVPARL